jgi:hypothetical protein
MADETNTLMTRRKLLMRLGFAAGAAYVAPSLAGHDIARASTVSWGSRPSRLSRASRPSRASWPSRPSRPSRPGGFRARDIEWYWDSVNQRWGQLNITR